MIWRMAGPDDDDGGDPSAVMRLLDTWFRTRSSPDLASIRPTLWTTPAADEGDRGVVLEQYKLCVEMADRVSARRGLANTFFLSLNSAIFAAFGVFADDVPRGHRGVLIIPLAILMVQCLAWFWTLRSYRQLNSAKYAVIGAMEERLPASPYWAAEWAALGGGRDPARYWPISHVESIVPAVFALAYLATLIVIVTTGAF
jgi:hypothetical protein